MRSLKGQFTKGSKPIAGFQKGHKFGVRFIKGKPSWIKGKKLDYIPHLKMRGLMSGSKNPAWKGGVASENEKIRKSSKYEEWRLQVFGRDNYTCRSCGARGVYLEAHHIKAFAEFPELRLTIDNGITLCKKCHNIRPRITLWWYNNIQKEAKIGDGTKIGSYADIGNVEIGKNCKIQTGVSIPEGWKIGDNVFIGPGARFANDKHPDLSKEFKPQGGIVKDNAVIGMGALIAPGIIIGNGSVVGMGAVVLKDVPDGETWAGCPAHKI